MVSVYRIDGLTDQPCTSFKQYKGVRSPNCMCRPCLDKFLDGQKLKGRRVLTMSEGWRPHPLSQLLDVRSLQEAAVAA
jgi:hypothetical protein